MDPQAIKSGFDAAKAVIDTLKTLREIFRINPKAHEEVGQQIELAEKELGLAEAQIAQALGYKLCLAHFPPEPMLKNRIEPEFGKTIFRCPVCEREEPPPEFFAIRRRRPLEAAVLGRKMGKRT